MYPLSSRVVLAAVLSSTGIAQAAVPSIGTPAFTLEGRASESYADATLLSTSSDAVRIALPAMQQELSAHAADSAGQPYAINFTSWANTYDIAVNAGYRITSLTLSGTFYGALSAGQGDTPGLARNFIGFNIAIEPVGQPASNDPSVLVSDLDGELPGIASTGSLALAGNFALTLGGYAQNLTGSAPYHDPVSGNDEWHGSTADVGVRDLILTVNVSPVPEPAIWMMLAAGLGGLALRQRRRD